MFNDPILASDMIEAKYFVWPLIALFGGNMLLGVIVQICGKKDNSWIDAWWSLSFLVPNVVILIMRALEPEVL